MKTLKTILLTTIVLAVITFGTMAVRHVANYSVDTIVNHLVK